MWIPPHWSSVDAHQLSLGPSSVGQKSRWKLVSHVMGAEVSSSLSPAFADVMSPGSRPLPLHPFPASG